MHKGGFTIYENCAKDAEIKPHSEFRRWRTLDKSNPNCTPDWFEPDGQYVLWRAKITSRRFLILKAYICFGSLMFCLFNPIGWQTLSLYWFFFWVVFCFIELTGIQVRWWVLPNCTIMHIYNKPQNTCKTFLGTHLISLSMACHFGQNLCFSIVMSQWLNNFSPSEPTLLGSRPKHSQPHNSQVLIVISHRWQKKKYINPK